ncbi:retropepsin-like aspartic protease [Chryseobacterium potabilaquae]|uniref:Aspartyl protease n=1 Tax=Chryseobacterium potabilaquae TaxID=2675057 RepID=A0A6N4XA62_9FLAO|nr:aspartyl protease family protein [Chryseobacterium potabilaquae]CAA7197189.1 hypothetical protein CHRY9293_03243 [Chryseobacterium potabilaquae]
MRKTLFSIFLVFTITLSGQGRKFFESGEVQMKNAVEKINLTYANDLPFVEVSINGKMYNFLLDTGAPTVISTQVYKELNLKKKYEGKVKDSQKNKQNQIFTELPEMIIDQVIFKNIGAIVMDLSVSELGCFKVDGIIGANQMSKLFWRINYSENLIEATTDLSQFDYKDYDLVIPFESKAQKTPVIETRILDKKVELTFDTGFSGRMKVFDTTYNAKKVKKAIKTFGTNAVGAYGAGKPAVSYIFRTDKIALGNKEFVNEIIQTGNSSLIGNDFFKNYMFILDWEHSKIYMKQIQEKYSEMESFGFGYRFIDTKPVVTYVFQEEKIPLKIGDSIVSINNVDLDHLDKVSSCYYFINRVERNNKIIDVAVRRDSKIISFKLEKKLYLQD